MSGETKIDGNSHRSSHYKFSWQFFPGFLSLALFSFLSLIVLLSVYANEIPFSPFLKPSALDVFVARMGVYLPYLLLASGFLAVVGGICFNASEKRKDKKHRGILFIGSILFALFLLVSFLPDLGAIIFPSVRDHNIIQNLQYYRDFSIVIPIFTLLTVNLGVLLVTVSKLRSIRSVLAGVSFLLMALLIPDMWSKVMYSGIVGLYIPVLNGSIISNMTHNLITFMSFLSLTGAELLLISSFFASAAFFPVFKK